MIKDAKELAAYKELLLEDYQRIVNSGKPALTTWYYVQTGKEILGDIEQLQAENAALRERAARLENLAKVVENYLEGDSDAEYLYVALKDLEAGGEGGE